MLRSSLSVVVLALGLLVTTGALHAQFGGNAGGPRQSGSLPSGTSRNNKLPHKEALAKLQNLCSDQGSDRPLSVLIEQLRSDTGLTVVINTAALTEEGISLDQVIEGSLQGLTWEEALDTSFSNLTIDYLVLGSTIKITSKVAVKETLIVSTYDLRDLITEGALGEPALLDSASVIDLIESMTPTGPWQDIDGEGGQLRVIGQRLVVCQNQRGHAIIEDTLNQLRRDLPVPGDDPVVVTYRLLAPDVLQGDPGPGGNNPLFSSFGPLNGLGFFNNAVKTADAGTKASGGDDSLLTKAVIEGGAERAVKFSDSLVEVLPVMVAPESWESAGGTGTIRSLPGVLIIRQSPAIHRKIREALKPFLPVPKTQTPYLEGLGGTGSGLGGILGSGGGSGFFQLPTDPQ